MENVTSPNDDYELWTLLLLTTRLLLKAREGELKEYGISTPQSAAMNAIQTIGDECTPAKVSRRLLKESHTVSGLLCRMEKQGLVKKNKDLDKKNLVRVSLTESGEQVYNQTIKRESIHRIMSSLSEKERQQFNSYLERLRDEALKVIGLNRLSSFM